MKFSLSALYLLPIFLACCISSLSVVALPVALPVALQPRFHSHDLTVSRSPNTHPYSTAPDGASHELARRTWSEVWKKIRQPATPEEKAHRKEFLKGVEAHRKEANRRAQVAKKEMGKNYNVDAKFHGPGFDQHHEAALKAANDYWHDTKELQVFRQADVSAKTVGKKTTVTAKYHNGGGAGAPSSTTYIFLHH